MSIEFEYLSGQGNGGQHMQKNATTVRATDTSSGISVIIRGRHREANKKKAVKEIHKRNNEIKEREKAKKRKSRRDTAIKTRDIIRTYHKVRNTVKDHRTGKSASYKDVVEKGKIELIAPAGRNGG